MEIDAKELRIGNYYDNNGGISQVTPDVIENVWVAKRQWVQGIPLTEEWLLKFGFKYSEKLFQYFLWYGSKRKYSVERCRYSDVEAWEWHSMGGRVKHVHQLQNLYFALTNEELTIK